MNFKGKLGISTFRARLLPKWRNLASFENRSEVCKKFLKKKIGRQNSNFSNSPNFTFFSKF